MTFVGVFNSPFYTVYCEIIFFGGKIQQEKNTQQFFAFNKQCEDSFSVKKKYTLHVNFKRLNGVKNESTVTTLFSLTVDFFSAIHKLCAPYQLYLNF